MLVLWMLCWSTVHGLAVPAGQGPLRNAPDADRQPIEELTLTFIASTLTEAAGRADGISPRR